MPARAPATVPSPLFPSRGARFMRKRILIVDDDPDILASLAIIFQESYEVALARDGAEALRFLDEGPHDVVLLDLMMPVLDGVAFMQELAARRAHVPVILASASA